MSSNVKIEYGNIIASLKKQINTLNTEIASYAAAGNAYYVELAKQIQGVEFYISDEQTFIKDATVKPNSIFVVVKFGSASTNFGSSICPITLQILGVNNKIKPAQMYFACFCARWSLQKLKDDNTTEQIWVTPADNSNFNEVADGFRTLFSVSGTLVIGKGIVKLGTIRYVYNPTLYQSSGKTQGYEDVDFTAYQDNFSNSLAPQPFGNTCGFTTSETNFSTFSFTITTFAIDSQLFADCMALKGFRKRATEGTITSSKQPNDDFELYLSFTNGFNNFFDSESESAADPVLGKTMFRKFKCNSINFGQKIGDTPTFSIGFTH